MLRGELTLEAWPDASAAAKPRDDGSGDEHVVKLDPEGRISVVGGQASPA